MRNRTYPPGKANGPRKPLTRLKDTWRHRPPNTESASATTETPSRREGSYHAASKHSGNVSVPFALYPIHVARQSYALHFYRENQREALGLVERDSAMSRVSKSSRASAIFVATAASLAAMTAYNIYRARKAERAHPPTGRVLKPSTGSDFINIEKGEGPPVVLLLRQRGDGRGLSNKRGTGPTREATSRYRVRPSGVWIQ